MGNTESFADQEATVPRLRPMTDLKRHLKRYAPTLNVSGMRQSRRLEGQLSYTVDCRRFARIYIYAERGVGDYEQVLRQVFKKVMYFQTDERKGDYRMELHVFGGSEPEVVELKKLRYTARYITITRWVAELAGHSNDDDGSKLENMGTPGRDDLVLVLLRDRMIALGQAAKEQLGRLKPERVVWVMLAEEGFTVRFNPGPGV